jgi:hypothetical protein
MELNQLEKIKIMLIVCPIEDAVHRISYTLKIRLEKLEEFEQGLPLSLC